MNFRFILNYPYNTGVLNFASTLINTIGTLNVLGLTRINKINTHLHTSIETSYKHSQLFQDLSLRRKHNHRSDK